MREWFNISRVINVKNHANGLRDKNHTRISTDAEKTSEKVQHDLIKVLEEHTSRLCMTNPQPTTS